MALRQGAPGGIIRQPVVEAGEGITFIGTATLLVRLGSFTVLTDPNFLHRGQHARLGYGLRSRRRTEPAMSIDELPPLDLIVLSHFHEDHFDRIAAKRLDHATPVVTTHQAARELAQRGFTRTRGLDRWGTFELTKGEDRLCITAAPARHGPRLVSRMLPPTMGSIWELKRGDVPVGPRLYVSGDTLIHDDLREIPRRFPDLDLAMVHLGGTRVLGVLVTMDAHQGVELMRLLQPRQTIPIHYDDYTVFTSTLQEFQSAVEAAGLTDRVRYLARGETLQLR